jgi:hypothetical protein
MTYLDPVDTQTMKKIGINVGIGDHRLIRASMAFS